MATDSPRAKRTRFTDDLLKQEPPDDLDDSQGYDMADLSTTELGGAFDGNNSSQGPQFDDDPDEIDKRKKHNKSCRISNRHPTLFKKAIELSKEGLDILVVTRYCGKVTYWGTDLFEGNFEMNKAVVKYDNDSCARYPRRKRKGDKDAMMEDEEERAPAETSTTSASLEEDAEPQGLSIVLKKSAERWLTLKQQMNIKSHDRLASMLLDISNSCECDSTHKIQRCESQPLRGNDTSKEKRNSRSNSNKYEDTVHDDVKEELESRMTDEIGDDAPATLTGVCNNIEEEASVDTLPDAMACSSFDKDHQTSESSDHSEVEFYDSKDGDPDFIIESKSTASKSKVVPSKERMARTVASVNKNKPRVSKPKPVEPKVQLEDCIICSVEMDVVKTLSRRRRKRWPYICPSCEDKHSKQEHEVICRFCSSKCTNFHYYTRHIQGICKVSWKTISETAKQYMYQCDHCLAPFRMRPSFEKHYRVCILPPEEKKQAIWMQRGLLCDICGYRYKSGCKKDLLEHHNRHTGALPFTCDECGKSFPQERSLKTHKWKVHSKGQLQCQYCVKSFHNLNSLTKHERTHTGEKPYECDQCEKKFPTPEQLKHHKINHTGNFPYSCEYCGRGFIRNSNMQYHIQSAHIREMNYVCKFCQKGFLRKDYCNRHENHCEHRV